MVIHHVSKFTSVSIIYNKNWRNKMIFIFIPTSFHFIINLKFKLGYFGTFINFSHRWLYKTMTKRVHNYKKFHRIKNQNLIWLQFFNLHQIHRSIFIIYKKFRKHIFIVNVSWILLWIIHQVCPFQLCIDFFSFYLRLRFHFINTKKNPLAKWWYFI